MKQLAFALLSLLTLASFASSRPIDTNANTNVNNLLNGGGTVDPCSLLPRGCGNGPTTPEKKITGYLTLVNCVPSSSSDVSVKINSVLVPATGTLAISSDRTVTLYYSKLYTAQEASGSFTLTPSVSSCSGGTWNPATRLVSALPAAGQDFVYLKGQAISLGLVAISLTGYMKSAQLRLNNYDPATQGLKQGSYFKLGAINVALTIPKATIDLDCGTLCPDLGDANFYVQDMNLNKVSFAVVGNSFSMTLEFESSGREIKGFYSPGNVDGLIPDFNIDNAKVTVSARPKVTSAGAGLTLEFGTAKLSANIAATGGCSYLGFDVCNSLFGTSGKIQKAMEDAMNAALGSPALQIALAGSIKTYLQTLGIVKNIAQFSVYNGSIYIVLAV